MSAAYTDLHKPLLRRKSRFRLLRRIFALRENVHTHAPDYVLVGIVALILILGLIMLASATSILSFQQTNGSYYFLWQQITHGVIPGCIVFFIAYRIPYTWYQRLTPLFLVIVYGLLLLVFIPQLRSSSLHTRSWIQLGTLTLQTSEIAKLSFILWLAGWCTSRHRSMHDLMRTSVPFFLIIGSIAGLIMLQPDTGTTLLFLGIALGMFYVAQGNLLHMAFAVGLGGVISVPLLLKETYRWKRLLTFWNPQGDLQGAGYQIYQGLIALGSGSWFGLGIGQSQQKLYFVPEIESDSIFAIIGEELGFIFSALLVCLFAYLALRIVHIAKHAPDRYGALIAWGLSLLITLQVLVNIGAIVGLLPLTGVPLPFISLGGTNIVVLLASVGILMNISTTTHVAHG